MATFEEKMDAAFAAIEAAITVKINMMPTGGLRLSCSGCHGGITGPLRTAETWLPGWLAEHKHDQES